MIIGVGLDSRLGLSFRELGEMGVEAARLGFESIWTPAGSVPDAFHICGQWSEKAIEVLGHPIRSGISVVPAPRLWRPLALAVQAATVSIRSEGRFVLGIGTGGTGASVFASAGLPNRPIAVMRDYLRILRPLLSGERITYEGATMSIESASLGEGFPPAPVYLAAMGPQMLRLAGQAADGVCLNWATPSHIKESRAEVRAGATAAGRDPAEVGLTMYVRVCVDNDVDAARRALGAQTLSYGMARPGEDPALGYRGMFGRMGFGEALSELEARRDAGASMRELVDNAPDEMLTAVGYYGPAEGAPAAFTRLSEGLDETIVRIVTARPGTAPVREAMQALTPALIRDS